MKNNIIKKQTYIYGSKYDDAFGYNIPMIKLRYYIYLEDLKDLILKLDFDGAISTRELLKKLGYDDSWNLK